MGESEQSAAPDTSGLSADVSGVPRLALLQFALHQEPLPPPCLVPKDQLKRLNTAGTTLSRKKRKSVRGHPQAKPRPPSAIM